MGPVRRMIGLLLPIVGGITCGVSGTGSAFWYVFNTCGNVNGAVTFGSEHRTPRAAALRGAASGVVYALSLIAVLHLTGNDRVGPSLLLPENDVVLFLLMAVPAVPLHMLGARLRNRLSPRPAPTPAPAPKIPVIM